MSKFDASFEVDAAAVIEAAAESILITTAELDAPGPSIVYVNPAFERITGWSKAEVVGQSPRILQGPKTDFRILTDLKEKLHSGEIWEGRTINYRKDGSEFWMEWSIVPLKTEVGRISHYVAVQRDVSARVAAEVRLREAEATQRVADRARANLARYFSPKVVETLAARDKPFGPVRRQELAVLFAEIFGFTKFSESVEPEQVIKVLRELHSWMAKIIFEWDGSIEGYIGDSVVAIFGFPESGNQDGTNALSCAYELLAAAGDWNRERSKKGLWPIRIGLGLNYGPVVLGDVGTGEYLQFTVIRDTVNTANRLEQATRSLDCDLVVGQELVKAVKVENDGESTAHLLNRLQHYGDFAIRGRSQAVEIWTLTLESRTGAPAVDEDAGEVPGGGITTHHDVGGVVLIKVGVEGRLADRAPARLLLEQVSAIEASRFPHQSPQPAILPVVAQARIEGTDFALDLHEAGHSGFVVARKPEPAVAQDPAVPPIDTEVAIDHPVPRLVGMMALGPSVGDPPDVIVEGAERALGDRIAIVIAPFPDHQRQRTSHRGANRRQSYPQPREGWFRVRFAPPVAPHKTFSAGSPARKNPQ
jgi:PAS domain S-box-containing protein